ncbi:MAG TPA: nitronate monooxygenase [Acidimicrobiales bacterium]|nr:nitronate monooxygenase [Acidimicrobiales bacterium]
MDGGAATAAMRRLGIDVPVVLAPMGGGPSTVALAAAVSNAGGLGSLAGGYLSPDVLRRQIRELKAATPRPFAVNLFVVAPADPEAAEVERAIGLIAPYRAELGLPARPDVATWAEDFEAQLEVVVEEGVPVFTYTFGPLTGEQTERLRRSGAVTMGTASNVAEAVALEEAGADLVCAQGAEAGGHHSTWLAPAEQSLIGTLALVPQVCDAVGVPVVAAGGVMDGRGLAAVLCLGAGAAQMGTAFLLAPEGGTSAPHRRALADARETDIDVTSTVTGGLARGIRNRLMTELERADVPPYPVMNALTAELRRAATAADRPDLMAMWAGQAVRLARSAPASEVVAAVVRSAAEVLDGVDGVPRSGRP